MKIKTIFYKNGELKDKEILESINEAYLLYQEGAICEARDIMKEIVYSIDLFIKAEEKK